VPTLTPKQQQLRGMYQTISLTKKFPLIKKSFFLSLGFRMTIGVLLVVLPMLAAIWFPSFQAINIIRSQVQQNLELKSDVLTQSISRWEQMNVQVLGSLSQDPSTVSMNASQQSPLLAAVNRSYSDRYLAEADNLSSCA